MPHFRPGGGLFRETRGHAGYRGPSYGSRDRRSTSASYRDDSSTEEVHSAEGGGEELGLNPSNSPMSSEKERAWHLGQEINVKDPITQ
jgi:hypothetical protein